MRDRLFHEPGLNYFWALNDECSDETMDSFIDAFVAGDTAAVSLHPRPGMLKPYGGDEWFEFVQRTVERCAERGLGVWLYDEDPYPSGNAGGLVTRQRPDLRARAIRRYEARPATESHDLYVFPAKGPLLWCGLVNETTGETRDLTSRVGVVRRKWLELNPWDSRYYYPATPLYTCPRAWTYEVEYAITCADVPEGFSLLGFAAEELLGDEGDAWGELPDLLNPESTRLFLALTHERYLSTVGRHFGKTIRAIFTDEPKYFGTFPWTDGLAEDFRRQFGYDLIPRLWHLFSQSCEPRPMLTRLHYRQWLGERFLKAWLRPVAAWCRRHGLALVGHISPEDDPVQQATTVTNLFPCHRHFAIPGIDLIVPAVGDHRHPLLNIGVVSAVSAAQQLSKPGVLSESLGASGLDFTVEEAGRILRWQLMMGVTTHVVHCAHNSVEGLRLIEAPPDFGPRSSRWEGTVALGRELADTQKHIRDATQIAPVAILWPVRTFAALPVAEFTADSPLRDELMELLRQCLDRQVGTHFLDEADLWRARVTRGTARLGRARYTHVLIPSCLVLHRRTIDALRQLKKRGVKVVLAGQAPSWVQTDSSLTVARMKWCPQMGPSDAVAGLPRVAELDGKTQDLRCTAWKRGRKVVHLLMNLSRRKRAVSWHGQPLRLAPGELQVLEDSPS